MQEPLRSEKVLLKVCLFALLLLLSSFSALHAQETMKSSVTGKKSTEVILRIKGLHQRNSVTDLENILKSYPNKILNHVIDKSNDAVTVLISNNITVIDLLQVLEMKGYHADYLNENKEYVAIDPDDEDELGQPATVK